MKRLVKLLRKLAGLEEGQSWHPLQIAVYGALGLVALVLVIVWATGTQPG